MLKRRHYIFKDHRTGEIVYECFSASESAAKRRYYKFRKHVLPQLLIQPTYNEVQGITEDGESKFYHDYYFDELLKKVGYDI